ncbi:MAG: hypothetical protein PF503_10410 [Desulfobacula sp.]|jgi:hypothetical protein|nr:hypothetical protein [Desulfobacula sp.]
MIQFRFIYSLIILFILTVSNAFGINLVPVTKLFEITHEFNEPSEVAVSPEGLIYIVDAFSV